MTPNQTNENFNKKREHSVVNEVNESQEVTKFSDNNHTKNNDPLDSNQNSEHVLKKVNEGSLKEVPKSNFGNQDISKNRSEQTMIKNKLATTGQSKNQNHDQDDFESDDDFGLKDSFENTKEKNKTETVTKKQDN